MILAVNLLAINKDIGGAYNYMDNLLAGLNNLDKPYRIKVYHTENNLELVEKYNNLELILCNVNSIKRLARILYENTIFQLLLKKHKVDIVLWPSDTMGFLKTKTSIVISHDFLPLINPKTFGFFRRLYLRLALKFAIRNADYYFFISNTTQNELLQIKKDFDINKSKILPNIINGAFKKLNAVELNAIKIDFELPSKFFLYVAHCYPHKNHIRLIRSFAKYRHESKIKNSEYLKLVLRGDGIQEDDAIIKILQEYDLKNDVIFIPRVPQLALIKLYNLTSALVFPSMYEGGGIPIMEAFACGCFIIASEIEAVKEFTGGVFLGFNPYSETSITDSLIEFTSKKYDLSEILENSKKITQNQRENIVIKQFYEGVSFLKNKKSII
jgi:glycosyltransferase involved in cell wall biosynthesis